MGSDHLKGRTLFTHCCHGACCGIGFVVSALFLTVMFWIVWCYLGLSIVQVSESQRRGLVSYGPTTRAPANRTEVPTIETSVNAISRSATTITSRGDSLPDRGKDYNRQHVGDLAKGDFAARNRTNVTSRVPEGSRITYSHDQSTAPPHAEDDAKMASSIVVGGDEDGVLPRRVSSSAPANRPEVPREKPDGRRIVPADPPRVDIAPTQPYAYDTREDRPRNDDTVRDNSKTAQERPLPLDSNTGVGQSRRDDIQSSRRSITDQESRDPNFERDYSRSTSRTRDSSRYDDEDDVRGSRGRYDKRERGRDSDDKFSKGDTRVYDDEDRVRDRRPIDDDRYLPRDRQDQRRRGDDDRYRDDDRYVPRDRQDQRRREDDDRYRDDDRYLNRDRPDSKRRGDDERYSDEDRRRDRDDERYRDEDRRRDRDDGYRDRDERYRGDDRSRDERYPEDKYRSRSEEDRFRDRADEDRRFRDEEYRYRPRKDEDRYRDKGSDDRLDEKHPHRLRDEERYRDDVRRRDQEYRTPVTSTRSDELPPLDRERPAVRQTSRDDIRVYESSSRDRSRTYDEMESRSRAPIPLEDRYRDDDYKRPTRYDDRDRIAPTRVGDEFSRSKSTSISSRDDGYDSRSRSDGRPRDRSSSKTHDRDLPDEERRYPDDRARRTKYYDDEAVRRTETSRLISPSSVDRPENSRRSTDEREYRTRLPDDRKSDSKYDDSRDPIVLDRRSYASDEVDDRDSSRTRTLYDDDRDDKYVSRIRPGDEEYVRRTRPDDDEYRRSRPRGDHETDRARHYEDYDRPPSRKYNEPVEERTRRQDQDDIDLKKESSNRDSFSDSKDRRYRPEDRPSRHYQDDDDRRASRYPADDRQSPKTSQRDPLTHSAIAPVGSRTSDDELQREKRFQNGDRVAKPEAKTEPERPLSAQDVIEAAQRHSDTHDHNDRKVFYPVFDPRVSNLTSPEIIRPNERRGITLTSRRRRRSLGR